MTIEELNTIRKNQGISYAALSKMSNVPLRTIENIFSGSSTQPTVRPNNPFPTPSKTPSYNQGENEKSNNKDVFVFLAILLGILAFCFWKKAKIEEEKGNISYWGNLFFFATLGAIILGLIALIN